MTKPGHNSGKGGPIDPAKLKSYVERIEAVEAEEADYKAAKKDIYVEVKAAGMRPKMVRKIVKERKKTESDAEDEAELELYRAALAMPGATYRSVSAKTGIPKSTLQRLVPRNKNGTSAPKPEDGDDGITETQGGLGPNAVPEETNQPLQAAPPAIESCGGVESRHAGRAEETPRPIAQSGAKANPLPVPGMGAGVAPGPHDTSLADRLMGVFPKANEAPATPSVGAAASEIERVASSVLTPHVTTDLEMPPIPSFLDRRTAQGRGEQARADGAPHPSRAASNGGAQ